MKRTTLLALAALTLVLRSFAGGKDTLVAHEWGTFTSVQGADGAQLAWNPFVKTDLPSFVYDRARTTGTGWKLSSYDSKGSMRTLVRMETPVIYFYAAAPRTVDVRVDFPQGRITEWYPQASGLGPAIASTPADAARLGRSFIEWKGVQVLAPNTGEVTAERLIRDGAGNHYYEARETAANLLRIDARGQRNGPEYDRLLFYRGAGNFQAPLRVILSDEDTLRLSSPAGELLSDLFVLTIRKGEARYQSIPAVKGAEARTVQLSASAYSPLSDARTKLMAEMQAALVKQGLYTDEARAMVQTWKNQWFAEEGTRVLYLLPTAWTDKTLPIEMNPRPSSLVRVMVGRSELIMPETERALSKTIATYQSGDTFARRQAVASAQKLQLGRFLEPAVQRVVAAKSDKEFSTAAWKLATEVDAKTLPGDVSRADAKEQIATYRLIP